MFESLSEKLEKAFKVLKGQGSISEINVAQTMKEIRKALLSADVDFKTAKSFTTNVNVQTYFAQKIANKFNKQYGTDLQIKTVELNYSGNVDLNNFLIKDHKSP